MKQYKTSLKWIPNPDSSPCYLNGKECKHKHEDYGRCRFKCSSYETFEDLKCNWSESINSKRYEEMVTRKCIRSNNARMGFKRRTS